MLITQVGAIVAPFRKGRVLLPTLNDAKRIGSLTSRAYLTAPPSAKRFKTHIGVVKDAFHDLARSVVVNPSYQGQVRMRKRINVPGDWEFVTFGHAGQLSKFVSDARQYWNV
jgi:hypothetical protein